MNRIVDTLTTKQITEMLNIYQMGREKNWQKIINLSNRTNSIIDAESGAGMGKVIKKMNAKIANRLKKKQKELPILLESDAKDIAVELPNASNFAEELGLDPRQKGIFEATLPLEMVKALINLFNNFEGNGKKSYGFYTKITEAVFEVCKKNKKDVAEIDSMIKLFEYNPGTLDDMMRIIFPSKVGYRKRMREETKIFTNVETRKNLLVVPMINTLMAVAEDESEKGEITSFIEKAMMASITTETTMLTPIIEKWLKTEVARIYGI